MAAAIRVFRALEVGSSVFGMLLTEVLFGFLLMLTCALLMNRRALQGGTAAWSILNGTVNPSGRSAHTWLVW